MTHAGTVVYLARHGQAALNESGVLRGLLGPPLDEAGRRQAALLGEALGWRQLSLVAASPLGRTRETAQPGADHAGLPVTVDRCLLDRDHGQWAGTPKDTVTAQWGAVDAAPGVARRAGPEPRRPDDIPQDSGCFNVLQWTGGSMSVLSIKCSRRDAIRRPTGT
jgi:broad specificity phosphatase PhoE